MRSHCLTESHIDLLATSFINNHNLSDRVMYFPANFWSTMDSRAIPSNIWEMDMLVVPVQMGMDHWSVVFVINPGAVKRSEV